MFKENLKILRKKKEISQEQLAAQLNVVRQTISKWEKGLSVPDAELLVKLSEILDVSVSDLLGTEIQEQDEKEKLDSISKEVSKLNKQVDIYVDRISKLKKGILTIIGVIVLIACIGSIYNLWNDMFYELGKNLYHLINH